MKKANIWKGIKELDFKKCRLLLWLFFFLGANVQLLNSKLANFDGSADGKTCLYLYTHENISCSFAEYYAENIMIERSQALLDFFQHEKSLSSNQIL